ncbi:hypothetical protein GCM10023205_73330 [Yinghuangia aomiensis]|uniref:Integrase catalytic domain-containing protein n=1 Tax=Yinghuangia aomiensis TaxID=676205 RepID=A0ABP9I937_9ACTN
MSETGWLRLAKCVVEDVWPLRRTNGKVERFNRTLLDEWAYATTYRSEAERQAAFSPWLHAYDHHRGRARTRGKPPATNLTGQYS